MIQLRHTGIYTEDIVKEAAFYKEAFRMKPVCEQLEQADNLIAEILQCNGAKVIITKLITEQGQYSGIDDMIELLQVVFPKYDILAAGKEQLFSKGQAHVCFGVEDIESVLKKVKTLGGKQATKLLTLNNGNKCCFCQDPEGNWIELIEHFSL